MPRVPTELCVMDVNLAIALKKKDVRLSLSVRKIN